MNAQHYGNVWLQSGTRVFFPNSSRRSVHWRGSSALINLKWRLFRSIFIKVLLKWQPMKCLGRDVTNLIIFYFEKWKRTHRKSQIVLVCFHFSKKHSPKRNKHTVWNTAISTISHKSSAASKSTSTGARYVTLDNKIKCLNLAFYFGNLTNKTVTGTAYMWGLLIANLQDQSLWSTNQKYWSNLLHSFLEVHNCVAPSTSHDKLHEFGVEKPISWAQQARFDFFAVNFTVWSHILSTFGDALNYCDWEWIPNNNGAIAQLFLTLS